MRRVIEMARRAPRTLLSLILAAALIQGCGSDPTNPDDGDPLDPPGNQAPTAAAGADVAVSVGIAVGLDGSGSTDADGDPLTYAWTLTAPAGSAAALDDASSETPSFVPDVEGAYVASLTVNDGTDDSSADDATITAADNTVTQSIVAAAGGSVASNDGSLTLDVPAGALDADTDISVTSLGAGQLPAVVADLPGEKTVYELGPDGTTFSTPVQVEVDIDDAVVNESGSASMGVSFLLSESGDTVEAMTAVELLQDGTDPTKATISGGLSHFSRAIFSSPSLTFTIEAPDEARVGEPFDATFILDFTGLGEPPFTASLVDLSQGPAGPDPEADFTSDFPEQYAISFMTNSYICAEAGPGEVTVSIDFESAPLIARIQLTKEVECTEPPPPLETDLIAGLYRAQRLLPIPGSDEEITTGGLVRWVNLVTRDVEELSEANGDPPEWVFALSDGNFLEYSTLGNVNWFVPNATPEDTMFVQSYDQPRHVTPVSENRVAVASALGDLGFITYTPGGASGSFQDAFRNLESRNNPQQAPATNLQAIWVSSDAQTFVGLVTEGNGDSATNQSQAVLIDADIQSGQLSTIPLPGIVDRILDPVARHQLDLECGPLEGSITSDLLCVISGGFDGPAFESELVDLEADGYVAIFTVDTFGQTAELLYSDVGNARIGAGIFPFDGSTTGVAVANQLTGNIDVWHVQASGVTAEFTVDLGFQCESPIDLILLAYGARGALACQDPMPAFHHILVIENLDVQKPPAS